MGTSIQGIHKEQGIASRHLITLQGMTEENRRNGKGKLIEKGTRARTAVNLLISNKGNNLHF